MVRFIVRVLVILALLGGIAFGVASWLLGQRDANRLAIVGDLASLQGDPVRGEYVATMGGCVACHTDTKNNGALLSGGVALNTPFGTLYSPNITSDDNAGIGDWSITDFVAAMLIGRSPSGQHYYPAFPYTSYTRMETQDLVDLKSWLGTVPAVSTPAPQHTLVFPFSIRLGLLGWKLLYFDEAQPTALDRGAYLVTGPGHCAECHAERSILGGISDRRLSGNSRGPDGDSVPGILQSDLSDWDPIDLVYFLETGQTAEGDYTGKHMSEVVKYSTSLLTKEDREAIAGYLLSDVNR